MQSVRFGGFALFLAHRQDPGSSKIPEGQPCPTHIYTQDGRGAEPCRTGLAPPMHRGTVLNARRVAVSFSSKQEQGARGLLVLNAPGATQSSSEAPLNAASLHNLQQPQGNQPVTFSAKTTKHRELCTATQCQKLKSNAKAIHEVPSADRR